MVTYSDVQTLQVASYGVNGHVKLPGPTQRQPNVYEFGTPYEVIYEDLRSKDEKFYEHKGLLQVLKPLLRKLLMNSPTAFPIVLLLTPVWRICKGS